MYDQASRKLVKLGGDNPRESWGEKSEDKVYAPPCLPVSHVPDQCEVFRDNGDGRVCSDNSLHVPSESLINKNYLALMTLPVEKQTVLRSRPVSVVVAIRTYNTADW